MSSAARPSFVLESPEPISPVDIFAGLNLGNFEESKAVVSERPPQRVVEPVCEWPVGPLSSDESEDLAWDAFSGPILSGIGNYISARASREPRVIRSMETLRGASVVCHTMCFVLEDVAGAILAGSAGAECDRVYSVADLADYDSWFSDMLTAPYASVYAAVGRRIIGDHDVANVVADVMSGSLRSFDSAYGHCVGPLVDVECGPAGQIKLLVSMPQPHQARATPESASAWYKWVERMRGVCARLQEIYACARETMRIASRAAVDAVVQIDEPCGSNSALRIDVLKMFVGVFRGSVPTVAFIDGIEDVIGGQPFRFVRGENDAGAGESDPSVCPGGACLCCPDPAAPRLSFVCPPVDGTPCGRRVCGGICYSPVRVVSPPPVRAMADLGTPEMPYEHPFMGLLPLAPLAYVPDWPRDS